MKEQWWSLPAFALPVQGLQVSFEIVCEMFYAAQNLREWKLLRSRSGLSRPLPIFENLSLLLGSLLLLHVWQDQVELVEGWRLAIFTVHCAKTSHHFSKETKSTSVLTSQTKITPAPKKQNFQPALKQTHTHTHIHGGNSGRSGCQDPPPKA